MEDDVIRGRQRTYYSVRIILLCSAIAALVAGLVSVPVVLILSNDAEDRSYQADLTTCNRDRLNRMQTNSRLVVMRRDAANLGELAITMAGVRKSEAKAFEAIGEAFHIENQVAPLVQVLQKASAVDKRIADEQSEVQYKGVVVPNCYDKDVIPKP